MIVAGTITGPFAFQVDNRYHGRVLIALCIYNSDALVVARCSLQGISGAAFIIDITLAIINLALLHNFFHLGARYLPTIHATLSVPAVFKIGNPSVKAPVPVYRFSLFGF